MPSSQPQYVVYLIGFKSTHKVYVGSSRRYWRRKSDHRKHLKAGIHCNDYLQRTYDKYGASEMRFEELEHCASLEAMHLSEQKWICLYHSYLPAHGYNLVTDVITPGTTGYKYTPEQLIRLRKIRLAQFAAPNKRTIPFALIGPNEERVEGVNLRAFCRERGLPYRSIGLVTQGRCKTCKGWRRADMPKERAVTHHGRDHVLISPDGQEVHVNNLTAYCSKHGLSYDSLRHGATSRSGWKLKR